MQFSLWACSEEMVQVKFNVTAILQLIIQPVGAKSTTHLCGLHISKSNSLSAVYCILWLLSSEISNFWQLSLSED